MTQTDSKVTESDSELAIERNVMTENYINRLTGDSYRKNSEEVT